jgi:isoleucyl-tRNA synthetase
MEQKFNEREEKIIKFWEENEIFEKSVKRTPKKRPDFVFYEGPPTANARPGIHHAETRVFKDLFCRYKTMTGFRVARRAGWDTHGLPVDLQIDKKLGLRNKKEIEQYGIKKFNKQCRESVWEHVKEWEKLTERIGFWLDMENAYITYDPKYMESVWFILKHAWTKKLLCQDYKVVPYCPRCGTALSSHEVAQGYKKIKETSVYVKLRVLNPEMKNTSLLVWTTTPWTLPGNVAAAVNPKLDYVKAKLKSSNEFLILAKNRLETLGPGYEIVEEFKGDRLVGLRYQAVYPVADESQTIYKVIAADFVSLEDGTGIVHIAPAFGAEDMEAIRVRNRELRDKKMPEFPVILNVGEDGAFAFDTAKWAGMFVKDADPLIVEDLRNRGLLFKDESYEHDYPFCWRCKTPLLYYAKPSWFIKMTKLRNQLIKNNRTVNWVPAHLKEGRFGEWLREVKDWAISRERYWGTPLPAWKCVCGQVDVFGSVDELLKRRYSENRYFIFRHGHSKRQVKNISSCWPEPEPLPLTDKGRKKVAAGAKKLAEERIDLIISSDLLRAKETAAIIAKTTGASVIYDKRLRELNVGELNGQDPKRFWEFIAQSNDRLNAKPQKGENLVAVRRRAYELISETDKNYAGKNVVLVSHELPLTFLEWTLKGMGLADIVEKRHKKKIKTIDTGEYRRVDFKILPLGDDMEIDLHRPFIDRVAPFCEKCGKRMRRAPEVLDCWLDSGSMPFAQAAWPFDSLRSLRASPLTAKKLIPPKLFPADFICEGIDQTRGWFYTLLAVSTALGFGAPYKNVVSMGHVLDEKGEKMSKSKGNVVDPLEMIEKYSADAVRWYFCTVNEPGDPKLYTEKDLDLALKKFLMTFWNCYVFLKTYVPDVQAPKTAAPANVLDRWIILRLNETIARVTGLMERYDVVAAARAIESFTVDDLSLWYVRRSRRRLQQPQSDAELKQAASVFAYVLTDLARMSAPFIPFLSEEIYQGLSGDNFAKPRSVHLEAWPSFAKASEGEPVFAKRGLVEQMVRVRELVALALAERAKRGVKIRQPLAKMVVGAKKIGKELTGLLAGEVNVKAVEFNPNLKTALQIDWNITPELKEEGLAREITRNIQELRKTAQFTPADRIVIYAIAGKELKAAIEKYRSTIVQETKAAGIEFKKPAKIGAKIETAIDKQPLWLGIEKC